VPKSTNEQGALPPRSPYGANSTSVSTQSLRSQQGKCC